LPSIIPEPYNGAFTAAGTQYNVAPGLLAALFSEENGLGGNETTPDTAGLAAAWTSFVQSHTDPNSGWPTSPNDAEGPFRFLPSTFTGLGFNIADINTLTIAADAAAKYVASNGATTSVPETGWQNAIFAYNHAQWYVNAVLAYYNYYTSLPGQSGGTTTTPDTSCSTGTGSGGTTPTVVDCSNPTGNGGDEAILCDAEQYNGIYYRFGGGHVPYNPDFKTQCPDPVAAAASSTNQPSGAPPADGDPASGNPSPCATDCSGLVSVAMSQAFGQNYEESVAPDGTMEGTDAGNWVQIPIAQAQPGDVVTKADGTGHVEIVEQVSGQNITTFGSHYTGSATGSVASTISYWIGAYHWKNS
jgi:hypothetical protein